MSVRRDAADLQAEMGDYNAAIELYRRVAMVMLESPLTKYSVKEIWLKQCLCALANDVSPDFYKIITLSDDISRRTWLLPS